MAWDIGTNCPEVESICLYEIINGDILTLLQNIPVTVFVFNVLEAVHAITMIRCVGDLHDNVGCVIRSGQCGYIGDFQPIIFSKGSVKFSLC